MKPMAFIFDLNGTMINDMEYHSIAWHAILNNDLNAGLTMAEVKSQMYGKNEELLDRVFGKGKFTREQVATISMKKEKSYQAAFRPHLQLIRGLAKFLERAERQGIQMAIGSAAIPFNIDFVLDNLRLRHYFSSIVSADEVAVSKPDPETFLLAAKLLGIPPENCVVFEDAPKGVEAALRANMPCIVLTTMHEKTDFTRFPNVLGYIADYTDSSLDELFK
jgi:HAD superfamily hydrolase (TIGR01509 family)